MGTHPIFESDFDCLTEKHGSQMTETVKAAVTIQSAFRGYLIRKRNKAIDLQFASLVAEIAPSKLLEFWDAESLSRKSSKPPIPPSIDISDCCDEIEEEETKEEIKEETVEPKKREEKQAAFAQLGLKEKPSSIGALLAEAGFEGRCSLDRRDLVDKRRQLLSDLWNYQNAILARRQTNNQTRSHHG